MALTYNPIATTTLGSAAASYTFSSIPATYTDLVLVVAGLISIDGNSLYLQFNSDTATNYSLTSLAGNGSTASSSRRTSYAQAAVCWNTGWSSNNQNNAIINIFNYANTTTYKTIITRSNNAAGASAPGTETVVNLWRKTPEAINSIKIFDAGGANLSTGFTATLFGIASA